MSKRSPSEPYVDVVVGGQAGSEGKGAVVAHLTRHSDYAAAVRTGSSNAGHTVYDAAGDEHVHQVIPSPAVIDPDIDLMIGAEASFGIDELAEEVERVDDTTGMSGRLIIDPFAAVINHEHREKERDRRLGEDIGSTVHGCGAVRTEKIWRSAGDVRLAGDYRVLDEWTSRGRVSDLIYNLGVNEEPVIIEGTQGTHLSMNHSAHWPFATSRDCVASSFLSSAGIPPQHARDIWMVVRTYPIRVGGNSGDMPSREVSFEYIARRAGHDTPPVEYTSVTNKKRRIFEFSGEQFRRSLRLNQPTKVAITFLDYLNADDYGVTDYDELSRESRRFVGRAAAVAGEYGAEVGLLKTGEQPGHVIDLRGNRDFTNDPQPGDLPVAGTEGEV